MKIIIPMAGNGSRFKNAGYKEEKYEIFWKGKTLFEHSINSLSNFFDHEFVFIGREETDFDKKTAKLLPFTGVKKYSIFKLKTSTSGQAQTVYEYTKNIDDDSILIFNIDTYIKPGTIKQTDIKSKYWWLVSNVSGEKWSFVKINKDGTFETSEKKKISDNASLGLYFFHSSSEYNDIFLSRSSEIIQKWKETYIAPMYNYTFDKKGFSITVIDKKHFKILGTPEDLVAANDFEFEDAGK